MSLKKRYYNLPIKKSLSAIGYPVKGYTQISFPYDILRSKMININNSNIPYEEFMSGVNSLYTTLNSIDDNIALVRMWNRKSGEVINEDLNDYSGFYAIENFNNHLVLNNNNEVLEMVNRPGYSNDKVYKITKVIKQQNITWYKIENVGSGSLLTFQNEEIILKNNKNEGIIYNTQLWKLEKIDNSFYFIPYTNANKAIGINNSNEVIITGGYNNNPNFYWNLTQPGEKPTEEYIPVPIIKNIFTDRTYILQINKRWNESKTGETYISTLSEQFDLTDVTFNTLKLECSYTKTNSGVNTDTYGIKYFFEGSKTLNSKNPDEVDNRTDWDIINNGEIYITGAGESTKAIEPIDVNLGTNNGYKDFRIRYIMDRGVGPVNIKMTITAVEKEEVIVYE